MLQRKRLSDIVAGADSLGKLRSAWETTEAAGDLAALPPGDYLVRVLSGELTASKQGTPGYLISCEVVEPADHGGRKLWHTCWLTAAALPMSKRDLGRLGITDLAQLERPLPAGLRLHVRIAVRRDDDGSERNRVTRIEAADPEPADPFAPAADADRGDAPEPNRPKGPAPLADPLPSRNGTPAVVGDGPYRDRR